jgi:short-subunit dehydrogenase
MVQPLDMEQPAHFAKAIENVLARWGRVDLMVHNAGISQRSYAHETDIAVDRRLMEVNYFGTVALTKALLPHMLAQGGGHFAVVTSLVGKFGFGVRSAYAGSKHALHGFFESLHIELMHKGIRVTMICPGPVQTPISIHALDGQGKPVGVMDEMQQHGMPVHQAARIMIRAIAQQKLEVVVGNFKERLGVKIHAWLPSLFFRMAVKQNPRGTVKF